MVFFLSNRHINFTIKFDSDVVSIYVNRSCWTKPRSRIWWESTSAWSDSDWRQNFRMGRDTFLYLCQQLRPYLERHRTRYRIPLTVEHCVAFTLWRLSTNIEYRSISHLFGIGLSTACMITQETVSTIVRVLKSRFIKVPRGTDLRDIVNGFRDRWGFPQCAGAIDGTHVPIIAPHVNKADYYNRKGH